MSLLGGVVSVQVLKDSEQTVVGDEIVEMIEMSDSDQRDSDPGRFVQVHEACPDDDSELRK